MKIACHLFSVQARPALHFVQSNSGNSHSDAHFQVTTRKLERKANEMVKCARVVDIKCRSLSDPGDLGGNAHP